MTLRIVATQVANSAFEALSYSKDTLGDDFRAIRSATLVSVTGARRQTFVGAEHKKHSTFTWPASEVTRDLLL